VPLGPNSRAKTRVVVEEKVLKWCLHFPPQKVEEKEEEEEEEEEERKKKGQEELVRQAADVIRLGSKRLNH